MDEVGSLMNKGLEVEELRGCMKQLDIFLLAWQTSGMETIRCNSYELLPHSVE